MASSIRLTCGSDTPAGTTRCNSDELLCSMPSNARAHQHSWYVWEKSLDWNLVIVLTCCFFNLKLCVSPSASVRTLLTPSQALPTRTVAGLFLLFSAKQVRCAIQCTGGLSKILFRVAVGSLKEHSPRSKSTVAKYNNEKPLACCCVQRS